MSYPAPFCYSILNWSAYDPSLLGRGSLMAWFDPSNDWHAAPSGKRGRRPTFPDAAT